MAFSCDPMLQGGDAAGYQYGTKGCEVCLPQEQSTCKIRLLIG
jgi:hypothetical protein